jgi:hypothetical protein
MWKQFVREIIDCKTNLVGFLQAACGWVASGDTSGTMFMPGQPGRPLPVGEYFQPGLVGASFS